jgi:hypothetical protein
MSVLPVDWKMEIVSTVMAKQTITSLDKGNAFQLTIPKLAASEQAIHGAEMRLGFEFDDDYAAFLGHGDGWDFFALSDGDLFSTSDYPEGRRYQEALRIMNLIAKEGALQDTDIGLDDVFPFCASRHSSDIYLMKKRHIQGNLRVYWFAGYLVDSFPSFLDFFRSMRAYDLRNIEDMKKML